MDLLDPNADTTLVAQTMGLDDLRVALIDACASVSAAQARIAQGLAVFRARNGHELVSGFLSFGQWASVDLGLSSRGANVLTPDDAAVVRAALETEIENAFRAKKPDGDETLTAPRPSSSKRVDALVGVSATALRAGPIPIVRGEHTEVVLHVDQTFLTGQSTTGQCKLTNGGSLTMADARRLACDASIRALLKGADGSTVDLGRTKRLVSDRQRRLLTARDHGCKFPGCPNTRYVDAHHVIHWEDGGPTDMKNLILLCNRHHRLLHHGAFHIDTENEHGHFVFTDHHNRPIRPPDIVARHRCQPTQNKPRALSGDPHYSINDAVTAMATARSDRIAGRTLVKARAGVALQK